MTDQQPMCTPEDLALLQSCGPGERCFFYGDKLHKLHEETLASMLESAFKDAYTNALMAASIDLNGRQVSCEIEDMPMGQTWMRVTITDVHCGTVSGVGHIPQPRPH